MAQPQKGVEVGLPLPAAPGKRIRYVRDFARGWNQGELAREVSRLGVEISRFTVNQVEQGRQKPSFVQAWAIAMALEVTLGQLGYTSDDYPELLLARDPKALKMLATPSYLSGKPTYIQSPLMQATKG